MPVVTVAAPAPADAALLSAIADAVADALDLGPGDVIATLVETSAVAASGGVTIDPWPVVTIHGSDRGAQGITRSRSAAKHAAVEWAAALGLSLGGVSTEWAFPDRTAPTSLSRGQPLVQRHVEQVHSEIGRCAAERRVRPGNVNQDRQQIDGVM